MASGEIDVPRRALVSGNNDGDAMGDPPAALGSEVSRYSNLDLRQAPRSLLRPVADRFVMQRLKRRLTAYRVFGMSQRARMSQRAVQRIYQYDSNICY